VSTSQGPESPPKRALTGARRRARERALELLYEAESKGVGPAELLAELPVAPDDYAVELVLGVGAMDGVLNELVSRNATGWSLDRMPVIDRCLLKIAAFELLAEAEVPVAVALDEAVELAKAYSTEDSGRYVNGVLSAIAAEVREKEPEFPDAPQADSLE
jgi:N utilization substance protein B